MSFQLDLEVVRLSSGDIGVRREEEKKRLVVEMRAEIMKVGGDL